MPSILTLRYMCLFVTFAFLVVFWYPESWDSLKQTTVKEDPQIDFEFSMARLAKNANTYPFQIGWDKLKHWNKTKSIETDSFRSSHQLIRKPKRLMVWTLNRGLIKKKQAIYSHQFVLRQIWRVNPYVQTHMFYPIQTSMSPTSKDRTFRVTTHAPMVRHGRISAPEIRLWIESQMDVQSGY